MKRRMIITIINKTTELWMLDNDKTKLEHGKWMSGSPVVSLPPSSQVQLRSEKQTGASYGTTGQATYINNNDRTCSILIKWDKPYGPKTTTCEASCTCKE